MPKRNTQEHKDEMTKRKVKRWSLVSPDRRGTEDKLLSTGKYIPAGQYKNTRS